MRAVAVKKDIRPDIYIGLIGAAGTDLSGIRDELRAQLAIVGYNIENIKVSQLLSQVLTIPSAPDEFSRIKELMAAGDLVRQHSNGGEGVAALVISELRRLRGVGVDLKGATAFVIDSLKHPSEVSLLDQVYGNNFFAVSVYLSKEERQENLKNKIARDKHEPPNDSHDELAKELMSDDEKGAGDQDQNVRETFPRADYFVNSRRDIAPQIKRFVELIFGEPFSTPTLDEYFMYLAKGAGYRSADLSRQVGAVIIGPNGEVVATGCNDVPYPGGGIFYEGRDSGCGDNRDFVKQLDPNYIEIQRSLIELIGILKEAKYVNSNESDSKIADALLHGQYKPLMANARVRNLIEFGRIVHAEMHAICEAAAIGRSVKHGILYCTTFPCHVCARHIIASGIDEVVYIEPYPKSLTTQLYADEIKFAHEGNSERSRVEDIKQVTFRPFHGIAPSLYQRVFRHRPRKDRYGTIATWVANKAVPHGVAVGVERPLVEANASNSVAAILKKVILLRGKSGGGSNGGKQSLKPNSTRSKTRRGPI